MVTETLPPNSKVIEVMPGPQAEFVASEAKYPAYIAGRRGGKTSASVIKMVRYMTSYPGAYFMFTVPTLGDVDRILLPKMREFFGAFETELWGWLEKKSQIVFPRHRGANGEGGVVFVRPASEPDSLRGPTLAAAAMDEIGTEDQYAAFQILGPAVFGGQKGFPHQVWVTSTPRVGRRWIGDIWRDHKIPFTGDPLPPEDYPMWRARTIDNFHLEADAVQSLLATHGSIRDRQQELEGEFISVEGLVFSMLNPNVHYVWPPQDAEFVRTVYGFDPGVTSPTAIIEWKQDRQGRKWATGEFYKRDADEYDWVKWLADRNANAVVCDQAVSEKQRLYWQRRYGIRFVSARDKSFKSRVDVWLTGIRCDSRPPTVFITPACPNTWEELQNLAYEHPRGQEWNTDKWASGSNDHAFDAGAYGLMEFERTIGRPPAPNVQLVRGYG